MIIECLVHATDATTVGNVAMARKGGKEGETTQTIAGKGQVKGRKLRERLFEVLRRRIGMSKKNRNTRKCMKGDDVHILPTNLLEVGPVKTVCCQHRSLSAACNLFPPEAEDHWVGAF